MFEEQINSEYLRLTGLVNGSKVLTVRNLEEKFASESFYYNYFLADSEYKCFQTLHLLSAENYYPDNIYNDIAAKSELMKFQSNFAEYDYENIKDLIILAVDLRFNFTVRPVTTLQSYLFSNSVVIDISEAMVKLKSFSGNDLILSSVKEILKGHRDNENTTISKAVFSKELFERLELLISGMNSSEIIELSNDLFEFIEELNSNNLLVLSLIIFFDDIRMYGLVEKLDSIKNLKSEFSKENLLLLIEEIMEEQTDFAINDETYYNEAEISEIENESDEIDDNYELPHQSVLNENLNSFNNSVENHHPQVENNDIDTNNNEVGNYRNVLASILGELKSVKAS